MSQDVLVDECIRIWTLQWATTTVEQESKIGKLYITLVLGLTEDTAEQFAKGDRDAYHLVGNMQSGIPMSIDCRPFWQEISRMFPGDYPDNILEFLSTAGPDGVLQYLFEFMHGPMGSEVLDLLLVNMHAYK